MIFVFEMFQLSIFSMRGVVVVSPTRNMFPRRKLLVFELMSAINNNNDICDSKLRPSGASDEYTVVHYCGDGSSIARAAASHTTFYRVANYNVREITLAMAMRIYRGVDC